MAGTWQRFINGFGDGLDDSLVATARELKRFGFTLWSARQSDVERFREQGWARLRALNAGEPYVHRSEAV